MTPAPADRVDRWVMNTYARMPVTFVRGSGMYLYDETGREYLDFVGGVAVNALGHSHPAIAEAVAAQAGRLTHTSNLYYTEQQGLLAEKLCALLGWPDGRVFFSNSGAEANECALKIARKWSSGRFFGERPKTVAALNSFHGRTFETLAATGQPGKWAAFAPLSSDFFHVPYDDAPAIVLSLGEKDGEMPDGERAGAVLLEPIQGEGGVIVPQDDYLARVSKACEESGATFIVDEVQTGIGRTGSWFCFGDAEGAAPSVVTMAKALGGGLPIGACAARGPWAEVLQPGDHATTLGGGPVVCAAALATLATIQTEGLLGNAKTRGGRLMDGLKKLAQEHPQITAVRGKGLMLGIELSGPDARDVALACMHDGLLVNSVTPSVVRLTPPLIVDDAQCTQAMDIIHEVLARRRIGGR